MSMDRIFSGAGRPGGEGAGNGRRYGVDMAKVTNIDDPEKLNRVKCKRITSDPDVGETDWMYVCSPLAGTNYGLYMMPKVGDLVLLSYLGGDVHRPFVIGSLWTKDVAAPYKIEGGKNETFSFRLPSGTEVVFSEASGKESVTITAATGAKMALDGEGKKILVTDKDGKNALTMDLGSGAVTVQADKKKDRRGHPDRAAQGRGQRHLPDQGQRADERGIQRHDAGQGLDAQAQLGMQTGKGGRTWTASRFWEGDLASPSAWRRARARSPWSPTRRTSARAWS